MAATHTAAATAPAVPAERERVKVAATIESVVDASASAKLVRVRVTDERFRFVAGQWVDFWAPGVDQVGGYSIASPPSLLENSGQFQLVVKKSAYPPAAWIHSEAAAGMRVHVRVGGSFMATTAEIARPMLLIAGGIGITPLYSILADAVERGDSGLTATLLYMARGATEQCLVHELHQLERASAAKGGRLRCVLYDTAHNPEKIAAAGAASSRAFSTRLASCLPCRGGVGDGRVQPLAHRAIKLGRVDRIELRDTLASLAAPVRGVPAAGPPTAFLCGPPKMADAMEEHLLALGLPKERVRLERWW